MSTLQLYEANEIGERVRSVRDNLQADAQQQIIQMDLYNLAMETMRERSIDLERARKSLPMDAYQRMYTTLLTEIEETERSFEEQEKDYAEYLAAVANTDSARSERLDAEKAQFEMELQEMQRRYKAVQEDTEGLKEQSCSLNAQAEALQAELVVLREKEAASERTFGEQTHLAATLQAATPGRELIESLEQAKLLQSENKNKRHMLEELYTEVDGAIKLQKEVESTLQDLQNSTVACQNEEGEAQHSIDELEPQAEAAGLSLTTALRTLDTLRADTDAAVAQADAEKARHGDMRKSVQAFEQSNETISAALDRVSRGCDALQAELSPDMQLPPEYAAPQAELQAAQKELEMLAETSDATNRKIDEVTAALQQATAETETLKDESATAKAATAVAQKELKRQRSAAVAKAAPSTDKYPPNIPPEFSARIVDLQKQLQKLEEDSKTTADMFHGLEVLMLQHSANIAQLEEQRKAHALEARQKVTLAEQRRHLKQQEHEKMDKLRLDIEAADAAFRADLQKIHKEQSAAEKMLIENYEHDMAAAAATQTVTSVPEKLIVMPASTTYQRDWNTGRVSPNVFDFDINTADMNTLDYEAGNDSQLAAETRKPSHSKRKKRKKSSKEEKAAEKVATVEMPQKAVAPPPVIKAPLRKQLHASSLSQRSQEDWGWDEDEGSSLMQRSALGGSGVGGSTVIAMGVENVLNIGETHSRKTHAKKPNAPRKKAQHSLPETW